MDLSNLSSDLPITKPISQVSVEESQRELASEFKTAAKSVASLYNSSLEDNKPTDDQKKEFAEAAKSVATLYRLGNNSNRLLHYSGYMQCLDDLLLVISEDGDVENWALTKKAEINNCHKSGSATESNSIPHNNHKQQILHEDFHIPEDYQFSMSPELSSRHGFKPGLSPPSVNQSAKQRSKWLKIKGEKPKRNTQHKQESLQSGNEHESQPDYDSEGEIEGCNDIRKKKTQDSPVAKKRRKPDILSDKLDRI